MKNFITTVDLINDFYPENTFESIQDLLKIRKNWKEKGIAQIEVDSYGRISVVKYYKPEELSLV